MIKQIENVRKEFSASLMNGAAYRVFMTYEATWLLPLFHLKLISTGAPSHIPGSGSRRSDIFGQTSARPFKLIPSGSGGKFLTKKKIIMRQRFCGNCPQSLPRVNEQTRRRMEVSILPLSNHIPTARRAKLSTPLETSARFFFFYPP